MDAKITGIKKTEKAYYVTQKQETSSKEQIDAVNETWEYTNYLVAIMMQWCHFRYFRYNVTVTFLEYKLAGPSPDACQLSQMLLSPLTVKHQALA